MVLIIFVYSSHPVVNNSLITSCHLFVYLDLFLLFYTLNFLFYLSVWLKQYLLSLIVTQINAVPICALSSKTCILTWNLSNATRFNRFNNNKQ